MYKAQEPDLFLRSNRAALCRGVELMSASTMLVGIALVTQLDRNKASLYLNSLILQPTELFCSFFFCKGERVGEVVQGENKGRKGRGSGLYVWTGASHQHTLPHYPPQAHISLQCP